MPHATYVSILLLLAPCHISIHAFDLQNAFPVDRRTLDNFISVIQRRTDQVQPFWNLGNELDAALEREWMSSPSMQQPHCRIMGHYSLFGYEGKILRVGHDRYAENYRVVRDRDNTETWELTWRCHAIV